MLNERIPTEQIIFAGVIAGLCSAVCTGVGIISIVRSVMTGRPAMTAAVSIMFGTCLLYLIVRLVSVSMINTRAGETMSRITLDLAYLAAACSLFPYCFGASFSARGWVAFGLLCGTSVLMIIHASIWHLKFWKIACFIFLAGFAAILILIMPAANLFTYLSLTAFTAGLFMLRNPGMFLFRSVLLPFGITLGALGALYVG